jgi:hypothetical protein
LGASVRARRVKPLPGASAILARSTADKGLPMTPRLRSHLPTFLAFASALFVASWGIEARADDGPKVHTETFLSKPWEVRALYPSMRGPARSRPFVMHADPNELIWMTGARMTVVDLAGEKLDGQDNLCHASIKSHHATAKYQAENGDRYGGMRHLPSKLFNIVAGQLDLDLPDGFGIPLYPDEPLEAFTMILNNDPNFEPFDFRVKTEIDYVYQRDLKKPMRALSKSGMDTKVAVETASHEGHDHTQHGAMMSSSEPHALDAHPEGAESCGLGHDDFIVTKAEPAGKRPVFFPREGGENFVMHFMVPPGRHEFRDKHRLRGLPPGLETVTAHYITSHLHVYGESVELIDVTEGKTVFKSAATPNDQMTAVVDLESWSSVEGLTLYADHEYEIVTTYNNTTDHEVDAMGVVYIYFENPYFDVEQLPGKGALASSGAE